MDKYYVAYIETNDDITLLGYFSKPEAYELADNLDAKPEVRLAFVLSESQIKYLRYAYINLQEG